MRYMIFMSFLFVTISGQLSAFDKKVLCPKETIVVSIAPYKFLTKRIVEDTFNVMTIVPGNADPHTYELSLRQVLKLKNARLWLKIGESFEGICSRSLGKSTNCDIVDLRDNLSLIPLTSGCGKNCEASTYDSHVWLSPNLLKKQAAAITACVSNINPDCRKQYESNLKKILLELDELHKEVLRIFENSDRSIPIIVTHGAYSYFCQDYLLKQVAVEKPSSAEPSLKEIMAILHIAKTHPISKIFLQKQTGTRQGLVLAHKLKLKPIILDPYAENVFENIKIIALAFASP